MNLIEVYHNVLFIGVFFTRNRPGDKTANDVSDGDLIVSSESSNSELIYTGYRSWVFRINSRISLVKDEATFLELC